METLVCDELRTYLANKQIVGTALCGSPFEMKMILDFTGLRGSGSKVYDSLIHRLPKWNYVVKKVDEWFEVTPEWVEYYNLTVAQKQKLEAAIKSGLASAAQAVADYELLSHDYRRYKEILDYFKAGKADESVLRSLFVDRVDAFTGEGYSLITMARRWPTIITDFLRMKEEWEDPTKIRQELDVSHAEAVVLSTKNKLYKEWKKLFFPEVKARLARIENLMLSRKKSIEEYRSWLKPYISQFKMLKQSLEERPAKFINDPFFNPGFGQTQAVTFLHIWAWKPYKPAEIRKPSAVITRKAKGFVVNPYDDFVRQWKAKIEQKYGVEITDKEVEQIMKDAVKADIGGNPMMSQSDMYYAFWDFKVILALFKGPPPEGIETDNIMIWPAEIWWMSQNVLLLHILELYAREKAFEKYINELVGGTEAMEKAVIERIEKELEEKKIVKRQRLAKFLSVKTKIEKMGDRFVHFFVRRGPYETVFYERVSKMFARGLGAEYKLVIDHIKGSMGIE
jgi:hypothetical protein